MNTPKVNPTVKSYLSTIGKKGRAKNSPAQQEASRKNGAKKATAAKIALIKWREKFYPRDSLITYSGTGVKVVDLTPPAPRRHTRAEVKCGQGVAKARKGDV